MCLSFILIWVEIDLSLSSTPYWSEIEKMERLRCDGKSHLRRGRGKELRTPSVYQFTGLFDLIYPGNAYRLLVCFLKSDPLLNSPLQLRLCVYSKTQPAVWVSEGLTFSGPCPSVRRPMNEGMVTWGRSKEQLDFNRGPLRTSLQVAGRSSVLLKGAVEVVV